MTYALFLTILNKYANFGADSQVLIGFCTKRVQVRNEFHQNLKY